jgi:threonylcarbamoyladenosine tRNA methylthiotransferase MtaB
MRTFSINTLGCKVNQYEGRQIRELLEQRGLHNVEEPDKPDLMVIHTCCVTHTASAKSRQCIRKVLRQNPNGLVLVSGCLPATQIGELNALAGSICVVRNRSDLAATLTHWAEGTAAAPVSRSAQSCPNISIKAQKGFKIKHKNAMNVGVRLDASSQERVAFGSQAASPHRSAPTLSLPPLTSFKEQTRAFLKVQDGCDRYCSYCIVPQTRPLVHSKPADVALREAQALVESGHREIVVTGVFLGAYGQKSARSENWPHQQNDNLADLLDKMAKIHNLRRIRLSSLGPGDVTDRLLDTLREHPNIMPHLHLSLQSGSDVVLKRMCRRYTAAEFKRTVDSIKTKLDRPAITTDIIVGFPGETDADFQRTVDLAKFTGFAKMHVFTFSRRRGTPAANMPGLVESRVVKRRSQILRDLGTELAMEYRRQFLGETAEVLIENDTQPLCGRSERYFRVYLKKDKRQTLKNNDIATVKLAENHKDGMIGNLMVIGDW